MFSTIKNQVKDNFDKLSRSNSKIYYVEIDREKAWECYLNGFDDPIEKQGHNCNCCKSFIRQYGGMVFIENNQVKSIWDIEVQESLYEKPIKNLSDYIHSLPVTDVFMNSFSGLGTDKNTATTKEGTTIVWNHFYVSLDRKFVVNRNDSIPTLQGQARDNKQVLKRSLEELFQESVETVLELIAQNSLYRGKEFEGMLTEFLKIHKEYKNVSVENRDNFCWVKSQSISQTLSRIRNTAIGTLLIDLSKGIDLDTAVTSFERVVAPTNYKRPTSLVTPKMIEEAKKRLEELDLLDSLERRFATPTDVSVENVIYVDKSSDSIDVFKEMTKDTLVNPKTLSKVEEIGIDDFIKNVIPKSKEIEVLVENSHLNNLVSLLTNNNKGAKSMFKWSNPFSWSYTGGITDSMKERVKEAGGKVDGVLRFSIQWNEDGKSIIDLDAHAYEPDGTHIYYSAGYRKDRGNKRTKMSGQLDVDMMSPRKTGVENIAWSDLSKMKDGDYKVSVHNFSGHKNFDGVRCEIEFNGEIYEFSYNKPFTGHLNIATITKRGSTFTVNNLIEGKSSINSKEKWGIKTNQFQKVKFIMNSPNYWTDKTGNKHYMFMLENCINDEPVRPFYNEFLREELSQDRKVFEIMSSKLKVEPSTTQLSGLGFSETQRNHLIVRVKGNFQRVLKVNF